MNDIIGKRFSKLIVIERAGKIGSVQLIRCKCDCGNETIIRYPNLISGVTTSCGCYKKQRTSERRIKDLTGQKFGELTVIERASEIGGQKIKWKCQCSCGRTCVVTGANLKSGNTTSCGCMHESINESIIIRILRDQNVKYEKEVKFDDLLAPSGRPLRFDFKIYTTEGFFLLEYQGLQHYQNDCVLFGKFSRNYSDKKKKAYCKNKSIELVEIKYDQDTESMLYHILETHKVLHDNAVPSATNCCEGVTTIP